MCANHPVVHRQLNCTFSKVTEPATMGLDQAEEDTRSSLAAYVVSLMLLNYLTGSVVNLKSLTRLGNGIYSYIVSLSG